MVFIVFFNSFKERFFPYVFSSYYQQYIYYKRCHFNIEKVKEGTGRVNIKMEKIYII